MGFKQVWSALTVCAVAAVWGCPSAEAPPPDAAVLTTTASAPTPPGPPNVPDAAAEARARAEAARRDDRAFYVDVASALMCEAGAQPWPESVVRHVISHREGGVDGDDERFAALGEALSGDSQVAAQVRGAAAARCPERAGGWVACAPAGSRRAAPPGRHTRWSVPPRSTLCMGVIPSWRLALTRSADFHARFVIPRGMMWPKVQTKCFRNDTMLHSAGCRDSGRWAMTTLEPCGPVIDRARLGPAAEQAALKAYDTPDPDIVVVEAPDDDGFTRVTAVLRCHKQGEATPNAP